MEPGLNSYFYILYYSVMAGLITDTVLESLFATYIVSPNP